MILRKGARARGLPKNLPKGYLWKRQFCKTCYFNCSESSCESPPSVYRTGYGSSSERYPQVKGMKVCSKYQSERK